MSAHSDNLSPENEDKNAFAHRTHTVRMVVLAFCFLLLFGALFFTGFLPRIARKKTLEASVVNKDTVVLVAKPRLSDKTVTLDLPCNIQAFYQATVYARADGFLKARYVDIGDHVHTGQLLATIETPELDKQVAQAQATLAQSKANLAQQAANLAIAEKTYRRWLTVTKEGGVSQEDTDTRKATYEAAVAAYNAAKSFVQANQSDLQRLEALKGFQRVIAPFSGTITQRNVDPGDLIQSGSSNSTTSMFNLAQTNVLRVFVNVPQDSIAGIHVGTAAEINVPEYPNVHFTGKVTRFAEALDPQTRTMLTEIQVQNGNNQLHPGMYGQASILNQRGENRTLIIPDNTLVVYPEGMKVIVVKPDNTVHYQLVKVGRDFGTEIEIKSGLNGDEALITNPTDDLKEGQKVDVKSAS